MSVNRPLDAHEKGTSANDATFADPTRRRRLFAVIAVATGIALVVGVTSIVDSISYPFENIHKLAKLQKQNANIAEGAQTAALESLKNRDIDGDGLSDYDEIFQYHTSPFVKDSDSDGLDDAQELKDGTNPNCPEGKNCSIAMVQSSVDTQALRSALKSSGAPSYIIDQTDDATLLKSYRETVVGTNTNISSADLQNLTGGQVRTILIANGLDKATLDNVDDQTLLQIFQDAVNSDTSDDSSS